ncbi:uncharacterized protein RCC_05671 [Ramularia collo-cygni]|uniref:rRNA-processing protein FYV7 n=1 Tax=Ramularia collo-cygni TaxID=112498 RepID=A0A2D3UZE9_9PEZI|nr:uncharacterized protein RCC_05671 [Ramularia collo-cygni]CZT19815.1 uncharacterized protein RCC_05671 [Ramularia collo-cygni]
MSEKRKRDGADAGSKHDKDKKRQRKGFNVGSENLPDGVHRRKNQAIKQALIDRARIKKDFAKLKRNAGVTDEPESIPQPASLALDAADQEEPTTAPHPDRQTLIEKEEEAPEAETERKSNVEPRARKQRKPKIVPFKKEYDEAQQRRIEAEERRKAREEAMRERQGKIEERERFRKAMAKARTGGPNGQRKLGRESQVLLDRVKRMVGQS